MKSNIYFLIRSFFISLLFLLLLPLHSLAASCPTNCSVHGFCNDDAGVCVCDNGWSGSDCSIPLCPDNSMCSGHGPCYVTYVEMVLSGSCICNTGWSGDDCSVSTTNSCRNNCSGHGSCNSDGSCSCDLNWFGSDCSISCPTNCSVHGFCDGDGGCICDEGYSGNDCSVPSSTPTPTPTTTSCPNNCSGDNGICLSSGNCLCDIGWRGIDCSIAITTICPNDCSGDNGICLSTGNCLCDGGWTGSDCSARFTCPNNCSGNNGICLMSNGECICDIEWTGSDCSIRSDKEGVQAIKDNIQDVKNLDKQALEEMNEEDYPSVLLIIDDIIEYLTDARDSIKDIDDIDIGAEIKLERLLESSINNHKKASSTIDLIINDPMVKEDEGLLAKLLKKAKKFLTKGNRYLNTITSVRG